MNVGFAGIVVVAAKYWRCLVSIGDVTLYLWIGGQLTTMTIIKTLIVPSIVAMMVPLTVLSLQ